MYAKNFVGTPGTYGSSGDGSAGTSAKIGWPEGIAVSTVTDSLYWAEQSVYCKVRKISLVTGIVSSVAGTGTCGSAGDNGPALFAQLNGPSKLLLDKNENLYVACSSSFTIRKVSYATGIMSTVVGQTGQSGVNTAYSSVPGTSITLNKPQSMVFDPYGNIIFSESEYSSIRKLIPSTGYVSIIAGVCKHLR